MKCEMCKKKNVKLFVYLITWRDLMVERILCERCVVSIYKECEYKKLRQAVRVLMIQCKICGEKVEAPSKKKKYCDSCKKKCTNISVKFNMRKYREKLKLSTGLTYIPKKKKKTA